MLTTAGLLFTFTTIQLLESTRPTMIPSKSINTAISSCPGNCDCLLDNARQLVVTCSQGYFDDRKLGKTLARMSKAAVSVKINAPFDHEHAANRFSYTMDFGKFVNLKELELVNGNIIGLGKGAMAILPKLKWLSLAHNKISFVDVSTFYGANQLQHLDLGDNTLGTGGLTSGTFRYLTQLRWLSLANNNLTEAPYNLFGNGVVRIETLDLSRNPRLTVAEIKKILADGPSLLDLSLADCQLAQLPVNMFEHVPRLRRLNLAGNQLGFIPSMALLSAPQLTALDVSNNAITHIQENALYGLNVQELVMTDNHLGLCYSAPANGDSNALPLLNDNSIGIHPQAFHGTKLTTIDLSHNEFQQFHASILGVAKDTVKILKLNGNGIRKLQPNIIDGMQLTALHIANTRIRILPQPGRLTDALSDLAVLNVSHNAINSLPYSTLYALSSLRVLDASYCRLTELDSNVLDLVNHRPIDPAYFDGNPFDCHCHIMPLQQLLRTRMQQYSGDTLQQVGQSVVQSSDGRKPVTELGYNELHLLMNLRQRSIQPSKFQQRISATRCYLPTKFTNQPIINVQRPPDCAVIFGASSGLTQKSELGILGALLSGCILLLGLLIVAVYVARTWRRKGVYHTRELSASQTNLSSDSSNASHSTHQYMHVGVTANERLF